MAGRGTAGLCLAAPTTAPHSRGLLLLSRLCRRRGKLFLHGLSGTAEPRERGQNPRGGVITA